MVIDPIRDTEHFIFASAFEVEPDDQGRIVLPDRLIAYASLGEAIYFLGIGDRVEVWNKELWEEKEASVAGDATKIIERLAKNK